jgi:hypothetical protein
MGLSRMLGLKVLLNVSSECRVALPDAWAASGRKITLALQPLGSHRTNDICREK